MKDSWQIRYEDMIFNLKLMGFKHTGLFPEQAYNWNIIRETIKNAGRKVKVLNLFAYTGAASIAALKEHAEVVDVDASKGMIDWAKENVISNNLQNENIKFYVDDVKKLVKREMRRGNKYDIIIMNQPSFGRGAKNEVWQVEKDLYNLIKDASTLFIWWCTTIYRKHIHNRFINDRNWKYLKTNNKQKRKFYKHRTRNRSK